MRPSPHFQKILEQLPDLNIEQLKEVKKRCDYALKQKTQMENPQDYLLDGILNELRNRGLGPTVPDNFRIKNSRSFSAYINTSERVKAYLEEAIPNMTFTQKKSIGVIAARCLAKYIESWEHIVSLETMLRHVSRIPAAIDFFFPEYASNGALRLLVESKEFHS